MARKSQHSFAKRQKELKRAQKAKEKMERRQAKKDEDAPNEDASNEDASNEDASDELQVSGQDPQNPEN